MYPPAFRTREMAAESDEISWCVAFTKATVYVLVTAMLVTAFTLSIVNRVSIDSAPHSSPSPSPVPAPVPVTTPVSAPTTAFTWCEPAEGPPISTQCDPTQFYKDTITGATWYKDSNGIWTRVSNGTVLGGGLAGTTDNGTVAFIEDLTAQYVADAAQRAMAVPMLFYAVFSGTVWNTTDPKPFDNWAGLRGSQFIPELHVITVDQGFRIDTTLILQLNSGTFSWNVRLKDRDFAPFVFAGTGNLGYKIRCTFLSFGLGDFNFGATKFECTVNSIDPTPPASLWDFDQHVFTGTPPWRLDFIGIMSNITAGNAAQLRNTLVTRL